MGRRGLANASNRVREAAIFGFGHYDLVLNATLLEKGLQARKG